MIRHRVFLLMGLCFLVLMFLQGCGYKDIEKRYFITAIGLDESDKGPDFYKVTIKISLPSTEAQSLGNDQYIILTRETKTISEAVRLFKSDLDRELDFSHTKAILLGKGIIDRNIETTLDWFLRRTDVQNIAYVAVGDPSAKDVLDAKIKGEQLASNAIFMFFGRTGAETPYVATTYLYDLKKNLTDDGIDAILPELSIQNDLLAVNNTYILTEKKAMLKLNKEETKILNSLKNYNRNLDLDMVADKNNHYFVVDIESFKTDYDIKVPKNQSPYIHLSVNIKGSIEESKTKLSLQNIDHYNKEVSAATQQRILALLKKCQKYHVDPLGFGLHYFATHFYNDNEVETWNSLYQNIKFNVTVNTDLRTTGAIQ